MIEAILPRLRFMAFATLVPALAACGDEASLEDLHREAVGVNERVVFEVLADSAPAAGSNHFRLHLREAGTEAPFAGAAVDVTLLMRTMGHGLTTPPGIAEVGGGEYAIDDLVFSMPGLWEVRYRATREGVTDEAGFIYDVP